jgi:hypothetical protein
MATDLTALLGYKKLLTGTSQGPRRPSMLEKVDSVLNNGQEYVAGRLSMLCI